MATPLNVIYKIAADISGLQSGVDRAAKATEGLESQVTKLGKTLEAAFTVAAVVKLGKEVLDFAGNLEDLSAQTGISTTGLQKFDLAFSQAGVSLDSVANASVKLAKNLIEGDKSTVGALEKLGLSIADLKKMAPEDQLLKVGDAIGKIQNPTEKAYAALQVFGKGGAELLKGLDGHLKDTVAKFAEMGLIVDEKTVKAIDDFGDQMGLLGKQLIAVLANALGPLMPALGVLLNDLLMPLAKFIGGVLGTALRGLMELLLLDGSILSTFIADVLDGVQKIPVLGKYLGIAGQGAQFFRDEAKHLDEQLAALVNSTDKTAESTKKATPPILGLGGAMKDTGEYARQLKAALEDYAGLLESSTDVYANYASILAQIGNVTYEGIAYDAARGAKVETLAILYGVTKDKVEQVIRVEKQFADQLKEVTERIDDSRDAGVAAATAIGKAFAGMPLVLKRMGQALGSIQLDIRQTATTVGTLIPDAFTQAQRVIATALTATAQSFLPLDAATQKLIGEMHDAGVSAQTMAGTLGLSVAQMIDRLRASGKSAIEIANTLGITVKEAEDHTNDWTGSLKTLGQAFVNLAQVSNGSMAEIARAIGTVFTTMDLARTSSDTFLQGLADFKGGKFEKGIGGITTALAGMIAAMTQATGSGSTLQNVLGGALAGFQFGGLYGAIAGGIVGAVRSATSGLSATEMRKILEDAQAAVIKMHGGLQQLYEDAQTAGISMSDLMAIFNNARTVEDFARAMQGVQEALDFQAMSMKTLDETVEKYHFTLAELGPTLQRQQLDKQAQELYQDFKVLTAAGIDTNTVLEHMGASVNEFVQNAIAMGAEVPAAMKPMLQHMIDMGTLVDANGDAFTSLEDTGLSFSETMTQGFNRLIDTVKRLTEAIARGLNVALDDLPEHTTVTVDVGTQTSGSPVVHAATGGRITRTGIQPIAWTPSGTDIIPAMLSPGEVVLNPSEQAAISGRHANGSDVHVTFAISTLDATDFQTIVEQKVFPALVNQLRRGRGVTAMRDVLG